MPFGIGGPEGGGIKDKCPKAITLNNDKGGEAKGPACEKNHENLISREVGAVKY